MPSLSLRYGFALGAGFFGVVICDGSFFVETDELPLGGWLPFTMIALLHCQKGKGTKENLFWTSLFWNLP